MVELIRENNIGYFMARVTVFVCAVLWSCAKKKNSAQKNEFIRLCQSSKDLWHSKQKHTKVFCIQFMAGWKFSTYTSDMLYMMMLKMKKSNSSEKT